jgi:dTDP-4-dehydrorhamnose reductase
VRLAVLGARGQLGAALIHQCTGRHDAMALTRDVLDMTNDAAVAAVLRDARPDVIINCAAYNDVDGAEDHPVEALETNAFAVRTIARAAAEQGATLVHYSTDFVFDGTNASPYSEDDAPNPRSVYAASKLLGEWFAEDAPKHYVLRVESLFGGAPGGRVKGTVHGMLNAMLAGQDVRVFEDRTVSPTNVVDAARATLSLIEGSATPGLYHCVNSGHTTWLEFAREMARLLNIEPRLVPARVADVKLRAQRPQYCALSNEKLRAAGIAMPSWQDALARYVSGRRDSRSA